MQVEDIKEIRREVRDYIISSFYVPDSAALADSASLIDTGVMDDTGVLEMVAFLESTFGVEIDDSEILPENLDSIARVAAFVCRKKTCLESATIEETDDLAVDDFAMGDGRHVPEVAELDDLHAR
ncbi:MAG TPA: acyl carrier protein [Burkholderiales bacterium]|nr:acyl carrier protein [Burkholderiales bacterium]